VVIIPNIPSDVVQAALQCLPSEVLPCADDTPETLAARLGASSFLDDAHVLNIQQGQRQTRSERAEAVPVERDAASSTTAQVVVSGGGFSAQGRGWRPGGPLFNYSAYGRLAEDVRSQPMPYPVFTLGEQLWLAAMPYLCEASRRNPPTHCQLLLYYVLFNSSMGRHRDNYTVRHLRAMLDGEAAAGSTSAGMENSQRLGSEVLLYTEGSAPMDFTLTFPQPDDLYGDIKTYVKRAAFVIPLSRGTLMVFKDVDDQFFCHEASFNAAALSSCGPGGCRICYVYRWCTSVKNFRMAPMCNFKSHVAPPGNVIDV
jgi:hypothetical protein